jgi:hypothetical protein
MQLAQNDANGARFEAALQKIYTVDGGTRPLNSRHVQMLTRFDRGFGDSRIANVLGPLETAIISMYEGRGRAVGRTCQGIFHKFQVASSESKGAFSDPISARRPRTFYIIFTEPALRLLSGEIFPFWLC